MPTRVLTAALQMTTDDRGECRQRVREHGRRAPLHESRQPVHARPTNEALHATQNSAEARCAHNEKRGRLVSPSEPVTALRSGPNSTRKVRATPKPLPSLTAQPRMPQEGTHRAHPEPRISTSSASRSGP